MQPSKRDMWKGLGLDNDNKIVTQSLFPGFEQIFGSKIQDFFPDFFQNNNFFFQTLSYQNR